MSAAVSETPDASTSEASARALHARTMRSVAIAIAASVVVLAVACTVTKGGRFGFGVVVGGVIGFTNFLVLAKILESMTGKGNGAAFWGLVYVMKIVLLFGGIALLLHSGLLSGVGMLVGFAALAPGIVLGGLLASPSGPTHGNDDTGTR